MKKPYNNGTMTSSDVCYIYKPRHRWIQEKILQSLAIPKIWRNHQISLSKKSYIGEGINRWEWRNQQIRFRIWCHLLFHMASGLLSCCFTAPWFHLHPSINLHQQYFNIIEWEGLLGIVPNVIQRKRSIVPFSRMKDLQRSSVYKLLFSIVQVWTSTVNISENLLARWLIKKL